MWWNRWGIVASFLLYLCSALELEGVVELNSTTFRAALESTAHVIVAFHAPWCPHCKALYPTLEAVAKAFDGYRESIVIAQVDATVQTELATYWGIEYFPTILSITESTRPSQVDCYEGSLLNAKQMVDWISIKTGVKGRYLTAETSEVLEITGRYFMRNDVSNSTQEDGNGDDKRNAISDAHLSGGPLDEIFTFVQFYAPWCNHCESFAPTYEALSNAFKEQGAPKVVIARMDVTQEKNFAKHYEATYLPMLRLFKGAEAIGTMPYIGSKRLDDMIEYLNHETGSNRENDRSMGVTDNTCSMKK